MPPDKALLRLRHFDQFQLNAVFGRFLRGILAGVALIDKGNLDRLAGFLLHLLCQVVDLSPIPRIGGRDPYRPRGRGADAGLPEIRGLQGNHDQRVKSL